jgi:Domain of unknown function (DUF4388)
MQLTGDLQKVSLPNLIQLIRNGGLTGKIALSRGAQQGLICFEKGSVIHAEQELSMGRETLMELFLWTNGTFSFIESEVTSSRRSIDPKNPAESTDAILRDGIAYADQQEFLDQMNVNAQTVFAPVEAALKRSGELDHVSQVLLAALDGRKPLVQILGTANIPRRIALGSLNRLVQDRLIVVREDADRDGVKVELPEWVVARLKQDNADISKAIVDMVIWVDRLKCWLFQADADFGETLKELDTALEKEAQPAANKD